MEMFNKLRNRMLLFNMISISVVILFALSFIYFVTYSNIKREHNRELQLMINMPFVPDSPFTGDMNIFIPAPERFSPGYRVSFVMLVQNENIEFVNSYLDFENSVYIEALEKTGSKSSGKITLEGRKWAYLKSNFPLDGFQHQKIAFLDVTNNTNTIRTLLLTLAITGLLVLLVILFFSYRFADKAVQPIEDSYNKQRQFVADASHEFKTPLAVISANIDAIQSSPHETVESQNEWFGYIRAELKRSTKLVDDLLYLAKAEIVEYDHDTPFNLSQACETACASMEAVLYENDIQMETNIDEDVIIPGDGEKITQVLYILLDNAGKYASKNGKVWFSLTKERGKAVIRVINTGNRIASDEMNNIFERFYRPDASRSQETGGFGLGLSIAKTIVDRSDGDIFVDSNDETTTFTVRLKIA